MVHVPDSELVSRAQDGDGEAFGLLVRRYLPSVYDFVARLVLEGSDASEATRDTFVAAADRIETIADPDALEPWLFGLAYDNAAGRIRARGRRGAAPAAAEALTDETDRKVWVAVTALDVATRAVLDLHARQRLDPAAVARIVGADPDRGARLVAGAEEELRAAVPPPPDDPVRAYAELGDVEPPAGLEEWVGAQLTAPRKRRGGRRRRGRGGPGWRRAAVAVLVLALTGLGAWYAAPRLAPDEASAPRDGAAAPGSGAPGSTATEDGDGSGATGGSATAPSGGATGDDDDADGFGGGPSADGEDAPPEDRPTASSPGPGVPSVDIAEPEDGHVALAQDLGDDSWAANIDAVADASDPDGQEIAGRWWSNRQSRDLGSSARVNFWLVVPGGCPGGSVVHTVTVAVTDPDGNTATDSIDLEVQCP